MNKSNLAMNELTRYSQQIKMEEIGLDGQEKLKNSRVLCIGLGGLGSPLLLYLAAAGVGVLGIVDDDIIELSNLHRQILYNHTHINKKKAVTAKKQLLAINPLIQVESYSSRLTEENAAELITQYDIIADGTDNFYTRYLIHSICFKLEKPYVYASASGFQGYCSIFHGKKESLPPLYLPGFCKRYQYAQLRGSRGNWYFTRDARYYSGNRNNQMDTTNWQSIKKAFACY